MIRRVSLLLAAIVVSSACRRPDEPARGGDAGSTSATAAAPTRRPGPRALCPFAIEPGVALGPIALGETLPQLEDAGLVVTQFSGARAQLVIPGADGLGVVLHVALRGGAVAEVWADDLSQAPDCVEIGGRKVARGATRSDVERMLGGCARSSASDDTAAACAGGGAYVGGRAGTVQIRVARRSN